jgi:hypothetical protein
MTLEPAHNKYIRFFDNIRAIQAHVISAAESHMFPRIDNTNVDRSVSLMHSVIMKALRKAHPLQFHHELQRLLPPTFIHSSASGRSRQSPFRPFDAEKPRSASDLPQAVRGHVV